MSADSSVSGDDLERLIESIDDELNEVAPGDQFGYLKGRLRQIPNRRVREAVENIYLAGKRHATGPGAHKPHLVFLLHGILTEAVWQRDLTGLLESLPNVVVIPIRYGYVDAIRFWCPLFTRTGILNHIASQVRMAMSRHVGARATVIAHSFGTYAIAEILAANADIKIHRLILCGTIVDPRFRWEHVTAQLGDGLVINECGVLDPWPVMAKAWSWGYGSSGTYGCQHTMVKNRYHPLSHSDMLTADFCRQYWLPLVADPSLAPTDGPSDAGSPPGWYRMFDLVPFKYLVVGILLMLGVLAYSL